MPSVAATPSPSIALPDPTPKLSQDTFAKKSDPGIPESPLPSPSNRTTSLVSSGVSDQVAAIHQPIREATRLEPTVVAIPVSKKSLSNERFDNDSSETRSQNANDREDSLNNLTVNTNVELLYRDVQNIKISGAVERVIVDDESVCKAMVSDSNGIMLLGIGQGKTLVKVWLATSDATGPRLQKIDVTVREAWEARASQHVSTFAEATQSIAELFPTARIALRSNENGSLTIFGRADSDEQAKQIASLVRKMFLVPVQDRIATATPK